MPTLPYSSDEFINILEDNANLHDQYEDSAKIITEAASKLQAAANDISTAANVIFGGGASAIIPNVLNESGVGPTGTYATATYYNLDFGAKIAYDRTGDIYIIMKGGTTTDYEYFRFVAGDVPSGVTVETTVPSSTSYVTMMPANLQVGIVHGVTGRVNMTLEMKTSGNSSYDYIDVTVNVTPLEELA